MKKILIGIGGGLLLVVLIVGWVTVKENQIRQKENRIRQLEDDLAVAESQVLIDTLIIEAIKVVETVDTVYFTHDRVIDRIDTLIQVRNDTIYAEIIRSGTAYFDTLLTPGRNRINLNMEFDYPEPQLRLMAGYSFYQKPQKRFGFGILIAPGITADGKFNFMLGAGLTYRIKSF